MNKLIPNPAKNSYQLFLISALLLFSLSDLKAQTIANPTVTAVTTTTATLGGDVTSGSITHRGTRWHTASPVGTNNQLEEASNTTGVFTQPRISLPAGTLIFFTAYARNGINTPVVTSESSFFTEPTQLTGGQFTVAATGETSIMLNFPSADSWEGTGATGGYVIFRNSGSAPSLGALADGAIPPADAVGDKIATITDGTATSFNNVTGLAAETDYYYTIIPFVWDGSTASTYNYNVTSPQTANDFTFSTEPASHPASFTATAVSSSQIDLVASAGSSGDGYIILRREDGSDPTTTGVVDGVPPGSLSLPAGTTLAGTTTTTTFNNNTGLSSATRYRYLILPYNANGTTDAGTYNYKIDGSPAAAQNDWTFATEPSGNATGAITVTPASSAQLNLSFNSVTTSGITNATGYIILVKSSAIVLADLAGLNDGAAPNGHGLFEAIINSTATNTYSDMGLSPSTTYHYAIVPFNRGADDETYNYFISSGFIVGNGTTTAISATFVPIPGGTAPVLSSLVLPAGSTLRVLTGFSVTSEGTQVITDIGFNYSGLSGQFTDEYLYRSTTVGTIGSEIINDGSPDGNFDLSGLGAGDKTINSTPVYYYLVVDVVNSVTTATGGVTVAPTQANIVVASGIVNNFSINRVFTFNTSQTSDIILNGSPTTLIGYRTRQDATVHNTDLTKSVRLATYQLRDGAGTDSDNKGTNLTSLTISLTHPEYVRSIALFDDDTDTEIAGTDQVVSGSSTIVFTPSSPVSTSDNDVRNLMVRATFMAVVNDNDQIALAITAATANTSGSGFSSVASWASTTTDPAHNHIDVIATKLAFNPTLPPTVTASTNFSATVKAFDGLNNLDVDRTDQFELTESGPGALISFGGTTLNPSLVAGQFTWNDLRLDLAGSYPMVASDDNNGVDFLGGDATGNITVSSPASSITQGTLPAAPLCYGTAFQTLTNIVILETDPAGISGSNGLYTFSIALPPGFVFDPTVASGVTLSTGASHDIIGATGYTYLSSNTVVQFSYTLNGTSNINSITIGGLKVGHPHPGTESPGATGSLDITRSGGSATIAGVTPGVDLGTVSASSQGGAITFTVDELPGDVAVDPATTNFNANANAVKLVPSLSPTAVFSGSGVTFVNPDYRFNPNSLSPGSYPITYTYTNGSGCQSVEITTFTVFTSGINGLNLSYCNNDPASGALTVDQTFIDQRMAYYGFAPNTWKLDYFTYYDNAIFDFRPIAAPNNIFDPKTPAYQSIIQNFNGRIPIGFAVCNPTNGIPCTCFPTAPGTCNPVVGGNVGVFDTYQFIAVKNAPNVSFTLPSNIYAYCEDNVPVTLTGAPANSTTIANDFFIASGGQGASISHSLVSGEEVWVFSPAAVINVTPSTSQTFDITYQYKNPSTGCSDTSKRAITVHARPSQVPAGNVTKTPAGPPNSTTIQLCQGFTGTFGYGTTDNTYSYRWYSGDPPTPANLQKIGATFNPTVNVSAAGNTPFYVTRTKNGCESTPTPLPLSVNVIGTPVAPSPNFSNATRQYCVGTPINNTHLEVPGSSVRWYNSLGSLVYSGSTPTSVDLGLNNGSANVYSFSVTQTEVVNSCQSLGAPITVTVKALPIVQILADAPSDASKICTTGGTVTFSAFDNAEVGSPSAINGIWGGAGLAGTLNPFPTQGKVDMDPITLASGGYTLTYNYTNSAGCSGQGSLPITILPKITPAVSVGAVCDGSPAIINNTSTISAGTSTIKFAEWTFGDGAVVAAGDYATNIDPVTYANTAGTYEDPQHIYPNTGTFQISGILTSSDGCKYALPASVPVTISPLPVANFKSENVCVNDQTTFTATTSIPVQTYDWDFAVNNVLAASTAVSSSGVNVANHTYSTTGKDVVRLVVTTLANCQATVTKPIFIVPNYTAIAPDDSYAQDFTANQDGWLAGGVNSSWQWGAPTGVPAPLPGNAWDTNLAGDNNPNESSWVISGCFDFSGADKPVISLDIWSDMQQGADGAVLQYNTSGNIEDNIPNSPDPDGDWITLGVVDAGINWYNENGISNSPGNQTSVSAGWTGRYAQWRKAIYKLDEVAREPKKVVFRIAFASSQPRGKGFTFDNIFVGERSRAVLLENFTNSFTSPVVTAPTAHNAFYRNFPTPTAVSTGEIVKVQYHTAFPGADPVNNLNQQMNNARAAFYGITESPTARLDGDFRNGNINTWLLDVNDDRVLTPSALRLNITPVKVGSVVTIKTTIENTTSQSITFAGANLFTVIVQKSVTASSLLSTSGNTEFVYVAKQMLPNTAGVKLDGIVLAPGGTYTGLSELTWDNPNGDAIVVFIQAIEGNNKNVYQAAYYDNPPLPDVITSTEDPAYADKINLFPNPANSEINVELPMAPTKATPMRVIDTYGRTVVEDSFAPGESKKVINTKELLDGMYIMQIDTPEGKNARRKVMVIHR